jgi:hypothetical protein
MADEMTLDAFAKNVANGSDEARLALAQQLKNAGLWTGKVSSKFDIKYYNALVKLEEKYRSQVALDKLVGSTTAASRYDVLTSLMEEGGEDTSAGPKTTRQTYVTSPTQTAKLLDTVAQDLLGRNLTKAEKAKYTRLINTEQKRQPSVTVSGAGFSTTTGGVDEEQFVTEKLQATGEAKTYRATDAYTVMMQELGGLR